MSLDPYAKPKPLPARVVWALLLVLVGLAVGAVLR